MIYSSTVARFPQAIFVLACGLVVFSLSMLLLIRADPTQRAAAAAAAAGPRAKAAAGAKGKGKAKAKLGKLRIADKAEPDRGRSRAVKHVGDGPSASQSAASVSEAGPSAGASAATVAAASGSSDAV